MQFTIPIDRTWEPERVINNFKTLRSDFKWKNFEFSYDADIFERQGYLVFHLRKAKNKKDKSSIILWQDKVQINSPSSAFYDICFDFATILLQDNEGNILIETLLNKYKAEGKLPREFQKASIDMVLSLYQELINGEIPRERVALTKQLVKSVLVSMIDALTEIGN